MYTKDQMVLLLKWHNSTIYQNIYQSVTISEIYRDLPLFWYSSLGNLSFPWKVFPANFKAIFSKNSSTSKLSTMENLSSPNLST